MRFFGTIENLKPISKLIIAYDNSQTLNKYNFIQLGFEAIDVAHFIVDEMKRNVRSKVATMIKQSINLDETIVYSSPMNALTIYNPLGRIMVSGVGRKKAYKLWEEAVKSESIWDHKWQISRLFPTMGLSQKDYHRYIHNNITYEIGYDIWSNIHYGYIGKAVGFSEIELLSGAGVAQVASNIARIKKDIQETTNNTNGFLNNLSNTWKILSDSNICDSGKYCDDIQDNESIRIGMRMFDNKIPLNALELIHLIINNKILPETKAVIVR